jgi:hypothetical protein
MLPPNPENSFQSTHADLLITSFQRLLGRPLAANPEALYRADAVVLSHDGAADPVLTYGNLTAQRLWGMGWDQLTKLPSRLTAEPAHRAQRDAMFAEMRSKGFIENYSGVRISATGQRFEIQNAIIWPLIDEDGIKRGEAATFTDWQML